MIDIADEEENGGGAGWMATFADLMSLLMCFFVLLLSFSEMDVAKYKQLAGSMKNAFGVQNQVKVKDIPKGTSVIAREFSPGRPNPTVMKTVQQVSADTTKQSLDTRTAAPGLREEANPSERYADPGEAKALVRELLQKEAEQTAATLRDKLAEQIAAGVIEVEGGVNMVTIRIRERGSFPSGSAQLDGDFDPIMAILRGVLKQVRGSIAVEGHTDDIPISTERFRSNWELSTERALSVAHSLLEDPQIEPGRFMIVGYADSRPRVPNDSWTARAQNRRVEIVIRRGIEESVTAELKSLQESSPELFEGLDLDEKLQVPGVPGSSG